MQAAHARFSRTELPRVTHVQTIFSRSMTESPSWHVLGSKQSAPGTLETLSLGWGRGGAGGDKEAAGQGYWSLDITPGKEQQTPPHSPTAKVPPGRARGGGPRVEGPGSLGTKVLNTVSAEPGDLSARGRGYGEGRWWWGGSKTQNKHITAPKGKVQSLNFKQEELGVRLSGR